MDYRKKVGRVSDLFSLRGACPPPAGEVTPTENGFVCRNEQYTLTSTFTEHPTGITKRCDFIENTSESELSICSILSKFVLNGGEHEVYSEYSEWCGERNGAWQPLVTEVCASNDDIRHGTGSVPFFALYNLQNGRGLAFHILADSTWRYRVRKFYTQDGWRKHVTVELGIDDKDLDLRLAPGETFALPPILYYEFTNKTDLDAYKLHRYCNEVYPAASFPVMYNSWLSRFDTISFEILSEQLSVARDLGAEYFVVDAGWFGKPNAWFDSVGDWVECTDASMRGRMREFADSVRSAGLKFGLWFEIERASLRSKAYAAHPEHYIVEGEQCFVDFGKPDTCRYILDILSEQIEKYGIEFIKFDFNACLTYDAKRRSFLDYFKGYRAFIRTLRDRFPSLYLQNCASGGLRMALANLDGFDSFWMSDDHSLYSQLEIFKTAMRRMPCRALEKWLTIRSLAPFEPVADGSSTEKILVSGDCGWGHMEAINEEYLKAVAVGGPLGISCDLTKLSPRLIKSLTAFIAEYKNQREFWMNAECRILCDTDSLTVLQFSDAAAQTVRLYTFAKLPHQNAVTVYPFCDGTATYQCSDGALRSGEALRADGVELPIGNRFTAGSLTLRRI